LLRGDVRRRRFLRHKGQLEVVDDAIDHSIVGDEGNDAHPALALRTEEWVHFIDFSYNFCPAAAGDSRAFLPHDDEGMLIRLCLVHLGHGEDDLAVGNIQQE